MLRCVGFLQYTIILQDGCAFLIAWKAGVVNIASPTPPLETNRNTFRRIGPLSIHSAVEQEQSCKPHVLYIGRTAGRPVFPGAASRSRPLSCFEYNSAFQYKTRLRHGCYVLHSCSFTPPSVTSRPWSMLDRTLTSWYPLANYSRASPVYRRSCCA
jgi:hypothetical protein